MRRLARRLFTICSAVSLLLGIAVIAFWVSGRTWTPSAVWRESSPLTHTRHAVVLGQGALRFQTLRPPTRQPAETNDMMFGFGTTRGVAYAVSPTGGPNVLIGDVEAFSIPFWAIALVTAILPAWWAVPSALARLVIPPGHCRSCGYDLRASPERCPECGAEHSPAV